MTYQDNNQRYNEGLLKLLSLRDNSRQVVRSQSAAQRAGTLKPILNDPYLSNTGDYTEFDDKYMMQNIHEEDDSEKGFIDNAIDYFKDVSSNAINSTRYMGQQFAQTLMSAKQETVRRDMVTNEILDKIERRNEVLQELNDLMSTSLPDDNSKEKIRNLQSELLSIDGYLKTEGKLYDAVLDMMYNYDKMDMSDKLIANMGYFHGMNKTSNKLHDKEFHSVFEDKKNDYGTLDYVSEVLSTPFNEIKWAGVKLAQLFGYDDKHMTKELIRNRDSNFELANKLYIGNDENYLNSIVPKDKIDKYRKLNQDDLNTHIVELKHRIDFAKRGNLYLPGSVGEAISEYISGTKDGIDIFDDPSSQWLKHHEEVGEHLYNYLFNPLDAYAEIGSTLSLFGGQIAAMGTEAAIDYAGKAAITALGPGKLAKGVKTLATLAGIGLHIGWTAYSRVEETKSEAIEAISQRLADTASKTGADLRHVTKVIKSVLNDQYGYNTDGLTDRELITLSASLGIKTGDEAYDNALELSSRGINKLINANNALAAVDYLQTLPFMKYGGNLISNALRSARTTAIKHTGKAAAKTFGSKLIYRSFLSANERINEGIVASLTKKAVDKWGMQIKPWMLNTATVSDYLYKKAKLGIVEGLTEGAEEGQQHLLQSRFRSGEYDDYETPYNMMSVRELFGNAELAGTAVADYWGLGFWDKDNNDLELIKAMNVGFASSMIFSEGSRALTNVRGAEDGNIRGVVNKLKLNKTLFDVLQNQVEDGLVEKHADILYKALARGGVSAENANAKLLLLKKIGIADQIGIDEKWIDDDMKLVNAIQYALDNTNTNDSKVLKEQGIKKYSDDYKTLVTEQAKALYKIVKLFDLRNDLFNQLEEMIKTKKDLVERIFSGTMTEEELNNINDTKFGSVIKRISENYDKIQSEIQKGTDKNKEALKQALDYYLLNPNDTESLSKFFDGSEESKQKQVTDFIETIGSSYLNRVMSGENSDDVFDQEANNYLDLMKKQYIKAALGDSKNAMSNHFVRKYIKSLAWNEDLRQDQNESLMSIKLKDLLKGNIDELVDQIYEYNQLNPDTKKDYVLAMLSRLDMYKRMQARTSLRNLFSNRAERLKYIRKITGFDINTDGLEGMVSTLDEINGKFKNKYDLIFNKDFENIFLSGEWDIDEEDEYINLVKAIAANQSVLPQLKSIADAFKEDFVKNYNINLPQSFRDAVYGKNMKDTEWSDFINQYNSEDAAIHTENEQNLTKSELEQHRKNKDKIVHDSAWKMIHNIINTAKERKLNQQQEQEEDVQREIDLLQQQDNQPQSDSLNNGDTQHNEDERTDAELRLESEFGNLSEKERRKDERKKKTIEEMRRKKKEESESESEDDEENDEDVDDSDDENFVVDKDDIIVDEEDIADENIDDEDTTDEDNDEEDRRKANEQQESFDDAANEDALRYEEESEEEQLEDEEESDDKVEEDTTEDELDEMDILKLIEEDKIDSELALAEIISEELSEDKDFEIESYDLLWYDEDGRLMYDNQFVGIELQKLIETDLLLSGKADIGAISQEELPDGTIKTKKQIMIDGTSDEIGSVICNTFFYNHESNDTVWLTLGNIPVQLDKPLAPGSQLSKKLSTPGWLNNVLKTGKAYYIVTASQEAMKLNKSRAKHKSDPRDAFSVALIIEDESNSYYCALRNLLSIVYTDESGNKHTAKGELELRNDLRRKNLNLAKILNELGVDGISEKNFNHTINNFLYNKLKEYAKTEYIVRIGRGDERGFEKWFSGESLNDQDNANRKEILKNLMFSVRQMYSKPGKMILSDQQIDDQIASLRNFRNKIIELFCKINTENDVTLYEFIGKIELKTVNGEQTKVFVPIKTVIPESVQQSNGKINNIKDNGNPVYRSIVPEEKQLHEVQRDIENGDLVIGYGKGLSMKYDKFAICDLFGDINEVIAHKGGLSGKLYWMVKNPFGAGREDVPIMLAEELFDEQETIDGKKVYLGNKDNLHLCLSLNEQGWAVDTGIEGYKPSAAEVLLYMLCGKLNIGTTNREQIDSIVEFFIHHGEGTLFKNNQQYQDSNLSNFAMKQFAYYQSQASGKMVLQIAVPILNETGGTRYEVATFDNIDELLFADTEEAVNNRKTVVHAIATQMHWNTDIGHMNNIIDTGATSGVGSEMSNFIRSMIQLYGKSLKDCDSVEDYLNLTISVAGCPLLSFKVSDFYEATGNTSGDVIRSKKVHTAAWMIKYKKIKTDVGELIFKDPFVFALGIKQQSGVQKLVVDLNNRQKTEPAAPKIDVLSEFNLFDSTKLDVIVDELGRADIDEVGVAQDEATRLEYLKKQNENNSWLRKNNYTLLDNIILVPNLDSSSVETIDKFVLLYNNTHDDKISKTQYLNDDDNDSYNDGEGVISCFVVKDSDNAIKCISIFQRSEDFNGEEDIRFSGVYSTNHNKGTFSIDEARKWLYDTLGISPYNVTLESAMRGALNELIYGLTQVCSDIITHELTGVIRLSKYAGRGIHYHEAWHYVNLLMHTREERIKIYDAYLKRHFLYAMTKPTYKLVEEKMAEDFRKYVEGLSDNSIIGKVKRHFNDVIDLLCIFTAENKRFYTDIYKLITEGKYKVRQLDQDSIEQFMELHPNGVNMVVHDIFRITPEQRKSMKNILTYQQFYDITDAIITKILEGLHLNTVEDVNRVAHQNFEEYFSRVIEKLEIAVSDDPVMYDRILDIANNKDVIRAMLIDKFAELGFTVKIRKIANLRTDNLDDSAAAKEDNPDNVWDKVSIEHSKKDNAAVRTKLFLRSIPKYNIVVAFNENTGEYETTYKIEKSLFKVALNWSYDEAWNKILNELWLCTSYGKVLEDGVTYDPKSIRGRVKQLISDPFFYALDQKLNQLDAHGRKSDDTQLKSLIFSTVNSYKNPVSFIILSDPMVKLNVDEDLDYDSDDSVTEDIGTAFKRDDRLRGWKLSDDGALKAAVSLPIKWSKTFSSMGLIYYDKKTKKSILNSTKVAHLQKQLSDIQSELLKISDEVKRIKKGTSEYTSYQLYLNDILYGKEKNGRTGVCNKLVSLCNQMGIPLDMQTLDVFAENRKSKKETKHEKTLDAIIELVKPNGSKSSISTIISVLADSRNSGKSEIQQDNKVRALDEVFNKYGLNSTIGKLAIAYNAVHPQLSEYSVKGPNGENVYPINMNNYITDVTRDLNDSESGIVQKLRVSPYCNHSVILGVADLVKFDDESTHIKVKTFIGMKDANTNEGGDYFGITPMEDYLSKLFITQSNQIVFPTMADKKTWYSIASGNLNLVHDAVFSHPRRIDFSRARLLAYEESEEGSAFKDEDKYTTNFRGEKKYSDKFRDASIKWYEKQKSKNNTDVLESIRNRAFEICNLKYSGNSNYNRFSDNTLNIFCGYFIDEIDSLIQYYSLENINRLVNMPSLWRDNFTGLYVKDKDGKPRNFGSKEHPQYRLDFSGNGGKFRYFYDVDVSGIVKSNSFIEGSIYNLNQHIEALWKLQMMSETQGVENIQRDKLNPKKFIVIGDPNTNDGFELVREFLQDLRNAVSTGIEGMYSKEALDVVNSKLMSMVQLEMDRISQDGSAILICDKKEDDYGNTIYVPTKVPNLLMLDTAKLLSLSGIIGYGNIYDLRNNNDRSIALFSTIANFVANSMISTIEVEKIYSGDPAFYKRKANKNAKTSTISITYDNAGQTCTQDIQVENLEDLYSDKIKRLGGLLSPGSEIRLDYTSKELEKYPELYSSHYTNLNVEDIECKSIYYDYTKLIFKADIIANMARLSQRENFLKFINKILLKYNLHNLSLSDAVSYLYTDSDLCNQFYDTLDLDTKDKINNTLDLQMDPYSGINVCDALVFIRPSLYRKIKIGLGEWSFKEDKSGYSDEIAYNILETDGSWMHDPKKAKIVQKLQLNALKMSYFGHENEVFSELFKVNMPIYNKMAIFPLFKFHASSNVGKKIYDRMNLKGHEIDMISFKSAVKVGGVKNGASLIKSGSSDENAVSNLSDIFDINEDGTPKYSSSHSVDYVTDTISEHKDFEQKGQLTTKVQELSNLRMQLNTHAHEADARSIGTQMFKIAFSNIVDDAIYGEHTGSELKQDIIDNINKLTVLGILELHDRFYSRNEGTGKYEIDLVRVREYVQTVIKSNGIGSTAEEIIQNGGVAAGLMSRTVFENSVSVIVNDATVNINTKGGTAIQQSIFGFADYGASSVATLNGEGIAHSNKNYLVYNGGKELKWNSENGTMEVLLSANFFKSVVPKDFLKSHSMMRQWLINHDVIKGSKHQIQSIDKNGLVHNDVVLTEGEMSNPLPFGIGYRIPTQGQSSMFAYTVADILPEQCGDLIVVPREFTAQTGSDFDVDKIYLANKSYTNGKLVLDDTKEGISNKLLYDYIKLVTDIKTYADARASIDTITKKLQNELLNPYLKSKNNKYLTGMTELLPSFQALRKMEFGVGKTGIGPFALNVSNISLTLKTHLSMDYGKNEYGFGHLDQAVGKDEIRVAAWLSAMVNAHVDVAKDPYVFDLNVNQSTYNHANFLIRAGMGISTFYFLSQPILKEFCNKMNSRGGFYSGDPEVRNGDVSAISKSKLLIINDLYKKYTLMLESIGTQNAKQAALYFKNKYDLSTKQSFAGKPLPVRPIDKSKMFMPSAKFKESIAEKALSNPNSELGLIYQLCALETFDDIDSYAQGISQLIKCSQIDTKKFGNNIISQRDFLNKYDQFIYGSKECGFIINTEEFIKSFPERRDESGKIKKYTRDEISTAALIEYFGGTFLDSKLKAATGYTRDILKHQVLTATDDYMLMFDHICKLISGESMYVVGDPRKPETLKEVSSYAPISNKTIISNLSIKLDNILRFTSFMQFGPTVYDPESVMLDFTMGGNPELVVNKMKELLFGNDDKKSIFERFSDLVTDIKVNPDKKIIFGYKSSGREIRKNAYEGLHSRGKLHNDLLEYLIPIMPSSQFPVGRMQLASPQSFTPEFMKQRYKTAFYQLLQHSNPEVSQLAKDLIFYAYYSTYDQNTANSFFDLVPYEYRKLYDLALAASLNSGSNASLSNLDQYINQFASNVLDIMCRNYWFDEQLVPSYYTTNDDSNVFIDEDDDDDNYIDPLSVNKVGKEYGVEVLIGKYYDQNARIEFPSAIISSKTSKSRKTRLATYIKLKVGNTVYLYKKAGVVHRSKVNKLGKELRLEDLDIFVVVPKAGLHSQKNDQFELYADYTSDSIFEQNMLPMQFAEDVVRQLINERFNKSYFDLYVNGENVKPATLDNPTKMQIVWDYTSVPSVRSQSNINSYLDVVEMTADEKKFGNVLLNEQSTNPYSTAANNAGAIVLLCINKPKDVNSKHSDKTVYVQLGQDVNSIAELISELLTANGGELMFSSFMNDYEFSSDNLPSKYRKKVDKLYQKLQKQYLIEVKESINGNENLTEEEKLNAIDTETESVTNGKVSKQLRRKAGQDVLNEYVNNIIISVFGITGNPIKAISTVAEKNKLCLAKSVNNASILSSDYINSHSNNIYMESGLNNEFKRSSQYRALKNYLNSEIINLMGTQDRVSIKIEDLASEIEKVIDSTPAELPNSTSPDLLDIINEVKEDDERKNEECANVGSNDSNNKAKDAFDALDDIDTNVDD